MHREPRFRYKIFIRRIPNIDSAIPYCPTMDSDNTSGPDLTSIALIRTLSIMSVTYEPKHGMAYLIKLLAAYSSASSLTHPTAITSICVLKDAAL